MNFKLYFKRAIKYFGSPNDQLNADMMDAMDYFKVSDFCFARQTVLYGPYHNLISGQILAYDPYDIGHII